MHIARRENHSFQWKPFFLVEVISFSGKRSFQFKLFLFVETIPLSGSHSFQWKPFVLVEAIPFSGSHSFQWKPFLLTEAIPFSKRHSFQWKPFLLVFQHFRQQTLSRVTYILKYIVRDCDSVRLLKMANLSCIYIPIELFQSSEAYLEPCQTSEMKHFCEN